MSNFPSVRPSLNLQFDSQPTPEDMTSHLASVGATFSRASIGTYTDANGLVAEASAGQARPNYSSAGVHEGLLIEESRVNLLKSSEDFSTNYWTKTSFSGGSVPTVTINQAIAPDGKASADLIVIPAQSGSEQGSLQSPLDNIFSGVSSATLTFYAKAESGTISNLVARMGATEIVVDSFGTDWTKIEITRTSFGVTSEGIAFRNRPSVSGDGSEIRFYLWGIQLETEGFPTSYIPTIPTFSSRASTATYFDSDGVLQTQAIQTSPTGVGRIDHKYIDGQWVEAGLLLEGASTNLVTNSEDLNTFTKTNTTVTSNQINGLDGTLTADKLTESSDAIAQNHRLSFITPSLTSGNDYTMSVFAKNNGRDYLQLTFNSSDFSVTQYATFNLSTGVIENAVDGTAQMQDVGNGWYRCSFTSDCTSSGASTIFFILSDTASGRDPSYIGDGTSGVYLWGAQLEQQSQPTSYIPTSGATADRDLDDYDTNTKERSADVCYIDGTAFTDFYNQEQGTILSEFYYNGLETSGNAKLYMFNDGTGDNAIFSDMPENQFVIAKNGSLQVNIDGTDIVADSNNKSVSAFQVNDAVLYTNGSQVGTDTSLEIPTVSELNIGSDQANSNQLNGAIKKLIYFPRRLTNNELIKLTQ